MKHIETVRCNNGREESVHVYSFVDDEHDLVALPSDAMVERVELRDRLKYREDLMAAEAFKASSNVAP